MTEAGYSFGGRERRGLVAGVRAGQLVILGVAGVAALVLVRVLPSTAGLAAAVVCLSAGAAAAFVPVAGRTADEWLPALAGWWLRGSSGQAHWKSRAVREGRTRTRPVPVEAPPGLAGVAILGVAAAEGREFGVLRDSSEHTYTAVLDLRPASLALADSAERQARLEGWADTLASLARPGCRVRRVQWIERTLPDDSDEIGRYLREELALAPSARSVQSYLDLVDEAGPLQQRHKTYLAVQVAAPPAARPARDAPACALLLEEVRRLVPHLEAAGIPVAGALTPRLVALALRSAFDPVSITTTAGRTPGDPSSEGCGPEAAWPLALEERWSSLRTDGAVHATYWVQEWPRSEVGADFLAPLLLTQQCVRTVAVTMEPVPPLRAQREVEAHQTGDDADDALRSRWGFRIGSRRRREREHMSRREEELAAGHTDVRFSGYVTVTGSSDEELERACAEVELTAQQSRLDLRRLHGEQCGAFTFTLPLGRGLR